MYIDYLLDLDDYVHSLKIENSTTLQLLLSLKYTI